MSRDRLREVEAELAKRLRLDPRIPYEIQILWLDRLGKLVEDELVAEWHELFAMRAQGLLEEE